MSATQSAAIMLRLSPALHAQVHELAAARGISASGLLRGLLLAELKRDKKENAK